MDQWGEGENSFAEDPPNAVLTFLELGDEVPEDLTVVLRSIRYAYDRDNPPCIEDGDTHESLQRHVAFWRSLRQRMLQTVIVHGDRLSLTDDLAPQPCIVEMVSCLGINHVALWHHLPGPGAEIELLRLLIVEVDVAKPT